MRNPAGLLLDLRKCRDSLNIDDKKRKVKQKGTALVEETKKFCYNLYIHLAGGK